MIYVGAVIFLVGLPSALSHMGLPARTSAWMNPFSQAEQALFDRIFPSLAGFPLDAFSIIAVFLVVLMSGIANRLRGVRIKAEARMDERPAVLLLRSFKDTALQGEPSRLNTLMPAVALTVFPLSAFWFAISNGEERILINEIDRLLGNTVRVLMLRPRRVKSAFTIDSRHVEIGVKDRLWEEAFLLLAQSSKAILLVPSATLGLLREVELLRRRSDLLERTVVILPPLVRRQFTWHSFRFFWNPAKSWLAVRKAWHSSSLSLPAYPDRGIAFLPNQDFSVRRAISLDGTIETLGAVVAHLLPSEGSGGSTSLAMASIEALTGRNYKRTLWSTAIAVSVLTTAILTASGAIGWTSWKNRRASERAVLDSVTTAVTEGVQTLSTKIPLDTQLSVALALYAWDHSGKKPLAVVRALLTATRNSIFDVDPVFYIAGYDPVIRVVPQDAGSLMVESSLSLRRFTVTPTLKETRKVPRDKFCVNGKVGMGSTGSLAIACDGNRTIAVSFGGKPKILPEAGHIKSIAIEGKRMIWVDTANQVVLQEERRVVWRTAVQEPVSQVLMSPDGRYAWIHGAATGFLIDLDRHTRVFSHKVRGNNGAGFSPSGRYFIEGGSIHDLTTRTVRETVSNALDTVSAVTSDGFLIAFGHSSGILEVVDGTGTWPIAKVDGAFRSLGFLGDTRRLAGGAGNQVFVFDVDAALRLRPLIKLLESRVAEQRAIMPDSEARDIDEQLKLIRGRARKLEPGECELFFKKNPCPAGV
jgi:hypothetical protein